MEKFGQFKKKSLSNQTRAHFQDKNLSTSGIVDANSSHWKPSEFTDVPRSDISMPKKPSGPPIKSLLAKSSSSSSSATPASTSSTINQSHAHDRNVSHENSKRNTSSTSTTIGSNNSKRSFDAAFPTSTPASLHLDNWIVVSGVSPVCSEQDLIQKFLAWGEISKVIPGHGNWMFIRYSDFSSAKQAVRLCQPYLLIASTTIVHVDCLTEEWLGRLQFPMEVLNAEKQSIPSFSFEKNAWNAMASSDSLRLSKANCLLPAKKKASVIRDLMEFIFSY